MTFDKYEYLTVKEAAALVGKSESTIKRFVRENKEHKKYFKYERLPTGHRKIYISKAYIELSFNGQNPSLNSKNEPLKEDDKKPINSQFVDYLLSELDRKNEELRVKEEKLYQLMEKNSETVDMLLQLQDQSQKLQAMYNKKQLEEVIPKRRWWQRKNR